MVDSRPWESLHTWFVLKRSAEGLCVCSSRRSAVAAAESLCFGCGVMFKNEQQPHSANGLASLSPAELDVLMMNVSEGIQHDAELHYPFHVDLFSRQLQWLFSVILPLSLSLFLALAGQWMFIKGIAQPGMNIHSFTRPCVVEIVWRSFFCGTQKLFSV